VREPRSPTGSGERLLGLQTQEEGVLMEDRVSEGGEEGRGPGWERGPLATQLTDLQIYAMTSSIEWVLPLRKAVDFIEQEEGLEAVSRFPLKHANSSVSLTSLSSPR